MAKGKVKTPGKGPGTSARIIGRAIIQEWIDLSSTGREMDAQYLGQKIRDELDPPGSGPFPGPLEIGVIADPVRQETDDQGRRVKFIWVCVPAPEEPTAVWLESSGYAVEQGGVLVPNDTKSDELGEAVLFGCGR